MNSSDEGKNQSLKIVGEGAPVGECTCSTLTTNKNYLRKDNNDSTTFESEFEGRSDCLDAGGKIIITDQNVGAVLRKYVLVRRRTKTILRRCVEHLNSPNNEDIVSNIFVTFELVCEDESLFDLIEPLSKYMVKHIGQYVDDEEFLEASHRTLKILFICGNLKCESEKDQFGMFTLLTRWVSHKYDERKLCFNELLKMINLTNFLPNYHCVEPMNHQDVPKKSHIQTDTSNNKKLTRDAIGALHVFVQYPCPDMRGKVMKVFSRKSTEWDLTDELGYPTIDNMRNVVINDKLYRLTISYNNNREQRYQIFSMGHSAQLILDHCLNPPPPMCSYDMCGLGDNVYLHGFADMVLFKKLPRKKFSKEELARGIFGYNCELDMWYSLPAENYTNVNRGYLTSDDQHRKLYLIGNILRTPLVQCYDLRVEKWQNLSKSKNSYSVAGCVMHHGKLYIGGFDKDSIQVYDLIAGKWDDNLKLVVPKGAILSSNAKIVLNNDELCFFNYSFAHGMIMNWSYNLNMSRWYSSPSLSSVILKDDPQMDLSQVSIRDAVAF